MLLKEVKNIFHAELDVIYGKDEVNSFFYLIIEHYFELERFVLALQPNLNIEKAVYFIFTIDNVQFCMKNILDLF